MSIDFQEINPALQFMFFIASPLITLSAVAVAYHALYRQAKPSISIYYEPNPDIASIIDLVIINSGGSAAKDLTFSPPIPINRYGIEKADSNQEDTFNYTIRHLSAGRELRYRAGQFAGLREVIPSDLEVTANYSFKSPIRSKKANDISILDIRYLEKAQSSNSAATTLSDALRGRNNTIFIQVSKNISDVTKELKNINNHLKEFKK
ncbi:hypothetical protein QD228_00450 [Cobetia sp. 3AK]|uniref:hypothetical protein n=1 Tax=Cobetia sp. 3AK TaxID=3040020 RepID=UPI0024483916|nr:hypothetical protein [Cobetia sp. 3AK]MDH2372318.1 hypothetical protein [Cobetia sp. 3AK]